MPDADIDAALDWVGSELPEALRGDSFARNFVKHRLNLEDALVWVPAGGRVLDVGSGIGVFPSAMARLGFDVASADLHTNNRAWLEAHGVPTTHCDTLVEPLPYPDGQFALVTLLDMIEHLHGSPRHLLSEVRRVLQPGGLVMVETPNYANLRKRLALLFGRHPMNTRRFFDSSYPYIDHVHEYTRAGLQSVLQWSGFEIASFRFDNVANRFHRTPEGYAPGLRLQGPGDLAMFAYLAVCKLVPSFRDCLLCVARKPAEDVPGS